MDAIIVEEPAATGRPLTGSFHTLSAGNTAQPPTCGAPPDGVGDGVGVGDGRGGDGLGAATTADRVALMTSPAVVRTRSDTETRPVFALVGTRTTPTSRTDEARVSRTVTRPVENRTTAVPDATLRRGDTVTEMCRTAPGTGRLLDMARWSTAASADGAPAEEARSDTAMMAMSVRRGRGIAVNGAG